MDTRALVLSVSLAGVIGGIDVAAGQHEGHQTGAAATPSTAQVTDCRQAQPVITGLLNAALKRLEDARLTNSAAAMRDAADDVQAALVDIRTQLAPCGTMQPATTDAHTTPAVQTSPGPPSTATQPGFPAAAPADADAHARHAAVPQSPASRAPAAAPARTPSTPLRPAAPAAADAPASHTTPAAAAGRATAAALPTSIADLKCTNPVDPKTVPRMLYQGRMYYFCTDASRAEFAKDPAKYVTAPPQAAPAHAH